MARNSQDLSQETDTSIDFWESRFLDSDPASEHQQGVEPEGESGETHDPDPPSRLSLSLEESVTILSLRVILAAGNHLVH